MSFFKRYLIAGLLVWLPLGVTIVIIKFLVDLFDKTLLLIPAAYRPETLLGVDIPGIGLLVSILVILITGVFVANLLGSKIVQIWESFLSRIPLVRSIYQAVKQIAEAVFGSGDQTFEKVYLIEYPRKGLWTLAFQTSTLVGEAQRKTGIEDVVNLFVPTTPNPTSGFYIIASKAEIRELSLNVDDALKMLISGGVVVPDAKRYQLEQEALQKAQTIEELDKDSQASENPAIENTKTDKS